MGSITLFRVRGIPVRLHSSFVLLAIGMAALRWIRTGWHEALLSVILGTLLFGSVLLHELGHAWMGARFGVRTRDVTLYPFGGVASMMLTVADLRAELWIALAGPLVNVMLAALGVGLASLYVPMAWPFVAVNAGMALFNLIPAYPMDGGRVLRAWWARRGDLVEATLRAIRLSRVLSWGFLLLSLTGRPSLALVGGFLLLATGTERRRWMEVARVREEQRARWEPKPWERPPDGVY